MPRLRATRSWSAWPIVLVLAACQPSGKDSDGAVAPAAAPPASAAAGEPASPWDAAAARGVAFRAVGNEPGWYVEVGRGATAALHATLDYGDRRVEVPKAVALDGDAFGYHGTATDGSRVVLRLRHEACSDGMSDRAYDTSAVLEVGGTTYRGCGMFLGD